VVQDRHTEASPTAALKSLCAEFRRPSGTRGISHTSPALEAPGYFQSPHRGEDCGCVFVRPRWQRNSLHAELKCSVSLNACAKNALILRCSHSLSLTSQESRQADRAS